MGGRVVSSWDCDCSTSSTYSSRSRSLEYGQGQRAPNPSLQDCQGQRRAKSRHIHLSTSSELPRQQGPLWCCLVYDRCSEEVDELTSGCTFHQTP